MVLSQQIHWFVAPLQALVGYFEQRFQEFQEKNWAILFLKVKNRFS